MISIAVLVPQLIGSSFQKLEISQQLVTRMHYLASEFSKIFRRWYPRTLTAGGATPSRTQHPARLWPGAVRPGVGTQILILLNFSAVVAPLGVSMVFFFILRVLISPRLLGQITTLSLVECNYGNVMGTFHTWKKEWFGLVTKLSPPLIKDLYKQNQNKILIMIYRRILYCCSVSQSAR